MKILVSISGIAGAGKSTLIRRLSNNYTCYIEEVNGNPYLADIGNGDSDAAYNSQLWFLEQQFEFLRSHIDADVIILDQDPSLIVHGYGKVLFNDGLISMEQFKSLCTVLEEAKKEFESLFTEHYRKVWLQIPFEASWQRVMQRDGEDAVLDKEWLERVLVAFNKFFTEEEGVLLVDSHVRSPDVIYDQICIELNK